LESGLVDVREEQEFWGQLGIIPRAIQNPSQNQEFLDPGPFVPTGLGGSLKRVT